MVKLQAWRTWLVPSGVERSSGMDRLNQDTSVDSCTLEGSAFHAGSRTRHHEYLSWHLKNQPLPLVCLRIRLSMQIYQDHTTNGPCLDGFSMVFHCLHWRDLSIRIACSYRTGRKSQVPPMMLLSVPLASYT